MNRRESLIAGVLFPVVLEEAYTQEIFPSPTAPLKLLGQERYFAKPGKANDVYQWRLHVCEVLEKGGVPRGTVFRGPGGGSPDVLWHYEFADRETARRLHKQVMADPQFKVLQEHMGTLIHRIEGSLYQELFPTSVDEEGLNLFAGRPEKLG